MIISPSPARRLPVSRQATQSYPIPPPAGINAIDPLASLTPGESIYQFNIVSAQYGSKVRTGYTNWVTEVGTNGVRTLMPFTGANSANDKLFAATEDGIYDVTSTGAAPAVLISFPSTGATSGYGVWVNFTTIAGHFILYTDELNGYYVYNEGGAWAKITLGGGAAQISGQDPATFAHVMIFKSRVWFIQKDSGDAWYLAAGTIYGAVTKFAFGNKFSHGGNLIAQFNWTIDGGTGIDDFLVSVSGGGDVVVYKGSDPATATDWFQHGQWYVGPPPAYRRIAGNFGGELFILSSYGLIPITRLMSSTLVSERQISASAKISPLVNSEMAASRTTYGWEVKYIPSENLMMVSAPKRTGFQQIQFVQSLDDLAWSLYRDVPYNTGETFNGVFYIGTDDGRVLQHTGNVDTVDDGLGGWETTNIIFSYLQAFVDPGPPNAFKRIQFIRPIFLSAAVPQHVVEARYDWNLLEAAGVIGIDLSFGTLWDSGVWDLDTWSGGLLVADQIDGGAGLGRSLAVATLGRTSFPCTVVKTDVMFDTGGLL